MADQCPICNLPLNGGESTCPHCGFRLPGSTQSFKPVVPEELHKVPAPADRQGELRVVRGPQTGVDITLRKGKMSLGRDPQCDIFLNDMTVSRRHAEIEAGEGSCVIRDTNSYNGVWVNDQAVDACVLKPGDVIQIGAFCLVYREHL